MAQFTKISDNSYKIDGVLTLEDIERINSIEEQTYLIMNNTKGQTSNLLSQINNENVMFQVLGGLDPEEKEKYNTTNYIARTYVSPSGLSKIVEYYENIESQINPNWTDTQKAMFLYGYMAEDIEYTDSNDKAREDELDNTNFRQIDMYNKETTSRSLNGLMYHSLVCAGYALCFKEGMDRLGIPCYYQNHKGKHDWNVAELDGKMVGLDLTWDSSRKDKCSFSYFGPEDFSKTSVHNPSTSFEFGEFDDFLEELDPEEKVFDLDFFTQEELKTNYEVISYTLNREKRDIMQDISLDVDGVIKYMPLNDSQKRDIKWQYFKRKYREECKEENKFIRLAEFLQARNNATAESFLKITSSRNGFLKDITYDPYDYKFTGDDIGIEELSNWSIERNYVKSPNGYKNYIREDLTNSLSEEDEKKAIALLEQKFNEYIYSYMNGIYNDADELLGEFKMIEDNDSIDSIVLRTNISSKLQSLINGKDYLISIGLEQTELEQKLTEIDNIINHPSRMTKEEKEIMAKKSAMEFYAGMMPEENKMREFADMMLNTKLTDEEWKNKSRDSEFMLSIIDTLKFGKEKFYKNDFNERELAKFVDCLNNIWSGNITEAEAIEQFSEFIEDEYVKKDEKQIEQTQTTVQASQDLTEEKQEIQQNQEDPIEIKEYVEVSNYNQNPNLSREQMEQIIQLNQPISTSSIPEKTEARHL